jgi:5'-methylthioadenosine phosphorylase
MGRLAVVLGSSARVAGGDWLEAAAAEHGAAVVQRHGEGPYVLPHLIDHRANLEPLLGQGCDRVLAVGSVGALRPELEVGTFVCPDDFIALHVGLTAFDDERAHATPGFDRRWRGEVMSAWGDDEPPLHDGGVYWQTIGPRFETPAEIALIGAHADVVGMTIASESVVARELGLAYAAICVVDNVANGLARDPLSVAEMEVDREANVARLHSVLAALLPRLGAVGP